MKKRKARKETAKKPLAAKKSRKPDAIDAMIDGNSQALALTIDPAWRPSVAFNLRLILCHAALVDGFTLPDDAEPAPVFRA